MVRIRVYTALSINSSSSTLPTGNLLLSCHTDSGFAQRTSHFHLPLCNTQVRKKENCGKFLAGVMQKTSCDMLHYHPTPISPSCFTGLSQPLLQTSAFPTFKSGSGLMPVPFLYFLIHLSPKLPSLQPVKVRSFPWLHPSPSPGGQEPVMELHGDLLSAPQSYAATLQPQMSKQEMDNDATDLERASEKL